MHILGPYQALGIRTSAYYHHHHHHQSVLTSPSGDSGDRAENHYSRLPPNISPRHLNMTSQILDIHHPFYLDLHHHSPRSLGPCSLSL